VDPRRLKTNLRIISNHTSEELSAALPGMSGSQDTILAEVFRFLRKPSSSPLLSAGHRTVEFWKKKIDLRGASRPPGIIRKKKAFSHRPRKPPNPGPGPTLGDVTREMSRLL